MDTTTPLPYTSTMMNTTTSSASTPVYYTSPTPTPTTNTGETTTTLEIGDHTVGQLHVVRTLHNETYVEYYSTPSRVIVISIIAVVLMLLTVIGNFLVIWSYRINRRLRDINNMFLVSLACSDLVIGIVSMNLYPISMITRKWWLGAATCTIWLCIDYTLSMASVANLLLICFDRYLSVTRPFTYRPRRTRSRAQIMIVSAWVISFLLFSPLIVIWPLTHNNPTNATNVTIVEHKDDECVIPFVENEGITIVTATLAFFIPILVMAVLYGIIYKETRKCAQYLSHNNRQRSNTITTTTTSADQIKNSSLISPSVSRRLGGRRSTAFSSQHRNSSSANTANNQISSSERKAARTLSAILLAFFVTWLPYNVCVVVKTLCGNHECVPLGVWDAAYYLCYINSTINPFCFALCNKTFRKTFIKILTCNSWSANNESSSRVFYESSSSSNGGGGRSRNALLHLSCSSNGAKSNNVQDSEKAAKKSRNSKVDVIL